jgi:hypothetical protein
MSPERKGFILGDNIPGTCCDLGQMTRPGGLQGLAGEGRPLMRLNFQGASGPIDRLLLCPPDYRRVWSTDRNVLVMDQPENGASEDVSRIAVSADL